MEQNSSVTVFENIRKNTLLRFAAGIGGLTLLLSGCGSETAEGKKPSSSASADKVKNPEESPTSHTKVSTPDVDHSDTGITNKDDAIAIISNVPPYDLIGSSSDGVVLINAMNGDYSLLEKYGITVEDISINYELNKLYINKTAPYISELAQELPEWEQTHTDGYSAISSIEDTKAVNYILGEILLAYQNNKLDLPSKLYSCPEPDDNNIDLGNSITGSVLLPPLGIFRYSQLSNPTVCTNLGEVSEQALKLYVNSSKLASDIAANEGLEATSKVFDIEYSITTLTDPSALKILNTYSY